MAKHIMDVSRWQGRIDWDAVKTSGTVDGVMLRVLGSKGGKRPTRPHGMWQYTSTGHVAGIDGPVDLSRAYKDYPAIIKKAGLGKMKGA